MTHRANPRRPRLLITGVMACCMLLLGLAGAVAAGSGTVAPPPDIVFVASNVTGSPDALTVGPMAGRLDAPLLITDGNRLSDTTRQTLIDQHPDVVIVAGGPNTITDAVMQAIADATGLAIKDIADTPTSGVVRVYGSGRDQTAAALSGLLTAYNPRFLPVDATAVDTDLLDGKDSTTYQQRITDTCGPGLALTSVANGGSVGCSTIPARRGVVGVSALEAIPEDPSAPTIATSRAGYWGRAIYGSGELTLVAPVHFPEGATVTRVTYVVDDYSSATDSCATLLSSDGSSIELGCSTGQTGIQTIVPNISFPVVGSASYVVHMTADTVGQEIMPIHVVFEYTEG